MNVRKIVERKAAAAAAQKLENHKRSRRGRGRGSGSKHECTGSGTATGIMHTPGGVAALGAGGWGQLKYKNLARSFANQMQIHSKVSRCDVACQAWD